MGDKQKPDPGKEQKSGLPQMNAMHVVIAVAVIVLAVIFIAKLGFGTDLISPSSGEMAILKKPVTPVQQVVQTPGVRPTFTIQLPSCASNQTTCGRICTDTASDPENCGACGAACPAYPNMTRRCYVGSCIPPHCEPFYADCNKNPADGCEIHTGGDPNNCGACGKSCGSTGYCSVSTCQHGTTETLTDPRPGVLH